MRYRNLFCTTYFYHVSSIVIPLRSERNWTPEQLWANGMMDLRNSHVTHVAEVQESINSETLEDLEWFEIDWYAPTPSDEGLSTI